MDKQQQEEQEIQQQQEWRPTWSNLTLGALGGFTTMGLEAAHNPEMALLAGVLSVVATWKGDAAIDFVGSLFSQQGRTELAAKLSRKSQALARPKDEPLAAQVVPQNVKKGTTTYNEAGGGFCDAGPEDEILDLGHVLQSKLPFKLHANRTFGEGLFVAGNQGSGKSVLLARTVEQFCLCKVTCIVFDLKPDFYTIPAKYATAINAGHPDYASQFGGGYYSVTVDNVDQFVADIMSAGNQVIVNLPSYEEPDAQGEIIAAIVEALMRWGKALDEKYRFPCYVFLDEAHNFLPQQTDVAPISKETAETVNKAFFKICNQGRAYGYTMAFFTQRIANIKKWVIANCQIKVIMKHGLDVDLKRCEEEISKKFATREDIEKLGKGQGIVIGWGVKPFFVQFKMRDSHHPSSTPDLKRARAFHAGGHTATTKKQATIPSVPPSIRTEKPNQATLTLEDALKLAREHPEIDPMRFMNLIPEYRETDDLPVQQEITRVIRSPYYEQVAQQPYYQSQYRTEPELDERRVDQIPTMVTAYQPTRRSSMALAPQLQKALDAHQRGFTKCRDLAEEIGVGKTKAAELMQQLKARKLI